METLVGLIWLAVLGYVTVAWLIPIANILAPIITLLLSA
jgi:hypothetical protein